MGLDMEQVSVATRATPLQDARFDWYAASIRDDVRIIADRLAAALGGEVAAGKPMHGYTLGFDIRRADRSVATVWSGGHPIPYAFATSDASPAFVAAVRELWPDTHYVTRADAAIDYDAPGAWDELSKIGFELAEGRRLKINQAGDWHTPGSPSGRTLYLGSPKSAVRLRIYEKGKQMRAEDPEHAGSYSEDWVRVELQVRPDKKARDAAAKMEPGDVFGMAEWSQQLGELLLGVQAERVHLRERRGSDRDRALYWLMEQYGEHLESLAEDLGGWDGLGFELRRMRLRRQVEREQMQRRPDDAAYRFEQSQGGQRDYTTSE